MNYAACREKLKSSLSARRFAHCEGVSQAAQDLAVRYGEDAQKAALAGLLHDCAKEMGAGAMLACAKERGLAISEVQLARPNLLHAQVGAVRAREAYGVQDEGVLLAIEQHIFGAPDMPRLSMVVNLADYIEVGRSFPDVQGIRHLAQESLEAAMLFAIRGTMLILLGKGKPLEPRMLKTYNSLTIAMRNS